MGEEYLPFDSKSCRWEVNKVLAGPISLLKYKQTRTAQLCSDNACQILGGRGLTRSGMGVLIEKFQRSQKMQATPGLC